MIQCRTLQCLRGRVLVVDDDAIIRDLLTAILEPQGFEVQTAANGPAALAAFHVEPFDVILTDFQMPGMSGLELAAEVQDGPDNSHYAYYRDGGHPGAGGRDTGRN
jgi:CheY-like chemotaxis protein